MALIDEGHGSVTSEMSALAGSDPQQAVGVSFNSQLSQQMAAESIPAQSFPAQSFPSGVTQQPTGDSRPNFRTNETFAGGMDTSGSSSHHHHQIHGPMDRDKAMKMGGLRFAPLYTELANEVRGSKSKSSVWGFLSVFLQILVGVITGAAAYCVGEGNDLFGGWRLDTVLGIVKEGAAGSAGHTFESCLWGSLAHFGIMLLYATVASLPVIFWATSAGSSGIPHVIGLLNGVDLKKDFTYKQVLARFWGVLWSCSAGLAVGPEGPMIFVGAGVGAILSNLVRHPQLWKYLGRPSETMNENIYLRDYVSTGAACGIAAAFKAPIAGTLFVIEEAASHFRREHLAKIFVSGVFAVVVAFTLFGKKGLFEYEVTSGDYCDDGEWARWEQLVFYCLVGIVCGMAGALFNAVNLRIMRFRARYANPTMPLRRYLDVVLICLVTSFTWVFLAYSFEDTTCGDPQIWHHGARCIKESFRYQIFQSHAVLDGDFQNDNFNQRTRYFPKPCLYGVQINETLCQKAYELARTGDEGSSYARTCTVNLMSKKLQVGESRCCWFESMKDLKAGKFSVPGNSTCFDVDFGKTFPSLLKDGHVKTKKGYHKDGKYNPMASLSLVPFAKTALNLFARGAPWLFPPLHMAAFLVAFFLLAAVTAGSAVPSGLLLPMIIIGALIGRLMTLLAMQVMPFIPGLVYNSSDRTSLWAQPWTAFFHYAGGPLAASAPQSTEGWLDPGDMAIVGAAAMLGGSSRIALMITVMMVEITGDAAMIGPVGLATLVSVVVGNVFNHGLYHELMDIASFPFLPDRWPKAMPRALRIYHILRSTDPAPVCLSLHDVTNLEEFLKTYEFNGFPVTDSSGAVVGMAMREHLKLLQDEQKERATFQTAGVDIGKVTDFHCITVRESLPLEVAFNFFKRMELQHVIVVDDNTRPVSVLTRSSLLPWRVEENIMQRGDMTLSRVRSQILRPRMFREGSLFDSVSGVFTRRPRGSSAEDGIREGLSSEELRSQGLAQSQSSQFAQALP